VKSITGQELSSLIPNQRIKNGFPSMEIQNVDVSAWSQQHPAEFIADRLDWPNNN